MPIEQEIGFRWSNIDAWLDEEILLTDYSNTPSFYLSQAVRVFERAKKQLNLTLPKTIISIAGSNGKGTAVLSTAAILAKRGLRVATMTSPHLVALSNRINFFGSESEMCNDEKVKEEKLTRSIMALRQVEGYESLGWYQKVVLACLVVFCLEDQDCWVLEVGLGGKYDAVRVVQCNIAVITTISNDHLSQLGPTMQDLAREKAGICIGSEAAIYADTKFTEVFQQAFAQEKIKTNLVRNINFKQAVSEIDKRSYRLCINSSHFNCSNLRVNTVLPSVSITAAILTCALVLKSHLKISDNDTQYLQITGRLQTIGSVLLDVAHNEQAVEKLAEYLKLQRIPVRSLEILICLQKSKDIDVIISMLKKYVKHWHLYEMKSSRFYSKEEFAGYLHEHEVDERYISVVAKIPSSLLSSLEVSRNSYQWLAVGSFLLVGVVLKESNLPFSPLSHQLSPYEI